MNERNKPAVSGPVVEFALPDATCNSSGELDQQSTQEFIDP